MSHHSHTLTLMPPHPAQAFGKPRAADGLSLAGRLAGAASGGGGMPQKIVRMFGKTKGGASREPSGVVAPTQGANGGEEWSLGAVAETEGSRSGGGDSPFAGSGQQPQPRSDAAL
jgi:hypothetical protein